MFKEIPEKSKAAQLLIKEASCDCEERQAKLYRKIETYLWISTIYEASWLRVLHYTKILKGAHYKIVVCGKDDHGDETLIKKIMHTGQQTWCFLDL